MIPFFDKTDQLVKFAIFLFSICKPLFNIVLSGKRSKRRRLDSEVEGSVYVLRRKHVLRYVLRSPT